MRLETRNLYTHILLMFNINCKPQTVKCVAIAWAIQFYLFCSFSIVAEYVLLMPRYVAKTLILHSLTPHSSLKSAIQAYTGPSKEQLHQNFVYTFSPPETSCYSFNSLDLLSVTVCIFDVSNF